MSHEGLAPQSDLWSRLGDEIFLLLRIQFVGIWWKERLEIFRKYLKQEASPLGREYFYQLSFRPSTVRCPGV